MRLVNVNKFTVNHEGARLLLLQFCCALFFLPLMGTEALAGYQADLMLRLASEGDASYLGASVYEASVATQVRTQAAYSAAPAQFRILLRNAGDRPDSFRITGTGSGSGFTVGYLDQGGVDRVAAVSGGGWQTANISPGESLWLLIKVTPALFTPGSSYRVTVSAVSGHDPAGADQVKTETVACAPTAAVTVSAPPDGSGVPGSVVDYPYTVTNVGNAVNSFALSLQSAAGWQGVLYADDGAGGGVAGDGIRQGGETTPCNGTGALLPAQSYRFFLAVSVPPTGQDGARAETQLAVTGAGASGSDRVTTGAIAPFLLLTESVRNLTRGGAFAAAADALPGDLLQYRMGVTNSGSAPASSVTVSSEIPTDLAPIPGTLFLSLGAEDGAAACAETQCGRARIEDGSIVAHLGQGGSASAGGSVPSGSTIYLFLKAQVQ